MRRPAVALVERCPQTLTCHGPLLPGIHEFPQPFETRLRPPCPAMMEPRAPEPSSGYGVGCVDRELDAGSGAVALVLLLETAATASAEESEGAGAWAGRSRGEPGRARARQSAANAPFQHPGRRLCLVSTSRRRCRRSCPGEWRRNPGSPDCQTLTEAQAKFLLQAGKRGVSAGGWPEGAFSATVKITRDGKTLSSSHDAIPFDSKLNPAFSAISKGGWSLQPAWARSSARGCGLRPRGGARGALLEVPIASAFCSVSPISSRPSIRQCLRNGSMSNLITPPSGPLISCARRSTVIRRWPRGTASSISLSISSCGSAIGRMPFLKQLL